MAIDTSRLNYHSKLINLCTSKDDMEKYILYGLANCGSCKKAIKNLKERNIDYQFLDIRENPPSAELIERAMNTVIERKRFLNTSGGLYRSGNFKTELPKLKDQAFSEVLSANPMLIKRPFLSAKGAFLVGYKQEEYDSI